jgi:hypothetical protein
MGHKLNSYAPLALQGWLQSAGQQKKIELRKLTTGVAWKHAKKCGGRGAHFRRRFGYSSSVPQAIGNSLQILRA